MPLAPFESDKIDHLPGSKIARRLDDALDRQWERHVLQHGQMRQQGKVLEHHAHLVAADVDEFCRAGLEQILAIEGELARRGLDQTRKTTHQGRLARPR